MATKKPSLGETARLLLPEKSDIAVIVLFGAVGGALTLIVPVAVQSFVNTIAFTALSQPLVLLTCVVAAVLCISGFARVCQSVAVEILQRRLLVRLVGRLGQGLPRATAATHLAWRASELSARFFEIVTVQKVVSTLLLDGLATALQTLLGMVLLAFYHPALLAFDIVLVIILLVIALGLSRGGSSTAIAESQRKYDIHRHLDDLVRNPEIFRAPGIARFAVDRLQASTRDWLEARTRHFRIVLRQHIGVVVLQAVASASLLAIGGTMVLRQQLSLGQLVAAEIVVTAVLAGASRLGKYMESYYDLLASSAKLAEVFAIAVDPERDPHAAEATRPATLEACDVTVSYEGVSAPIVSNFSLTLAPGHHVAIVGESASGKSAIASLLAAVAQPQRGHVIIDGLDAREWRAVRDRIMLLSDSGFVSGSVIDNVRLAKALTLDEVYLALRTVGLLDVVSALPEGAATQLGASHTPLSHGERVLLVLARAFAQGPRLLIIDGLLDSLGQVEAKRLLGILTSATRPWTLVLTTRHRDLAEALGNVVELGSTRAVRSA